MGKNFGGKKEYLFSVVVVVVVPILAHSYFVMNGFWHFVIFYDAHTTVAPERGRANKESDRGEFYCLTEKNEFLKENNKHQWNNIRTQWAFPLFRLVFRCQSDFYTAH